MPRPELTQALEQLQRMHRALQDLRTQVLPKSEQHFRLMAEGPLEEIRRLESTVLELSGRTIEDMPTDGKSNVPDNES